MRVFLAIIAAFVWLAPALEANAAAVPRKFAGIVVDAKSGGVLYESSADGLRYPASVTKVMTLYVLFQELAAGNLRLSTKMRVSAHAAAAVPTKLGLKAGSTISVEDAIKSLVTLSANDIARVIAEHISGTESKFAERMTETARALGMRKTTYRNASGLPDSGQVTTVRDQSLLAIAVYQHFPDYYEYFQTRNFRYGSRSYGNHNRLLGENGVDGIKTGYIRASGYNLMTAARKDGRHIVVVAFGFDSGGARNTKVRALVSDYLHKGRKGNYVAMIPQPGRRGAGGSIQVASATPVVPQPYPAFRVAAEPAALAAVAAVAPAPAPVPVPAAAPEMVVVTASISASSAPPPATEREAPDALQAVNLLGTSGNALAPMPADRPIDIIGAWISDTFSLGAEPAPLGQTRPSAPLVPPVGIGEKGEPVDLMTSGSIGPEKPVGVAQTPAAVAEPVVAAPPAGGWVVQIGATPTPEGANGLLVEAASSVAALGDFKPFVERFEKNGQIFFRARFGGFGGRNDATVMCNQLKQVNMSCLAMQS